MHNISLFALPLAQGHGPPKGRQETCLVTRVKAAAPACHVALRRKPRKIEVRRLLLGLKHLHILLFDCITLIDIICYGKYALDPPLGQRHLFVECRPPNVDFLPPAPSPAHPRSPNTCRKVF